MISNVNYNVRVYIDNAIMPTLGQDSYMSGVVPGWDVESMTGADSEVIGLFFVFFIFLAIIALSLYGAVRGTADLVSWFRST